MAQTRPLCRFRQLPARRAITGAAASPRKFFRPADPRRRPGRKQWDWQNRGECI